MIWAIFLATVIATPPACFLGCINDIARFCPAKQADVECICHVNEAVEQCIVQYCNGIQQLSARDHFAGTCAEYEFVFERSERQKWPVIDSDNIPKENSNGDHPGDYPSDHPSDHSGDYAGGRSGKPPKEHTGNNPDDTESNNPVDLDDCRNNQDGDDISKQVLQKCMEFILKLSEDSKHSSLKTAGSRNADDEYARPVHGSPGTSAKKRRPKRKVVRVKRPDRAEN